MVTDNHRIHSALQRIEQEQPDLENRAEHVIKRALYSDPEVMWYLQSSYSSGEYVHLLEGLGQSSLHDGVRAIIQLLKSGNRIYTGPAPDLLNGRTPL